MFVILTTISFFFVENELIIGNYRCTAPDADYVWSCNMRFSTCATDFVSRLIVHIN